MSEYSQQTLDEFIKDKLCQNDPVLYKYYAALDAKKFKNRIIEKEYDISTAVQTFITGATRDIILETIENLAKYMKPMGDLIISGGEAFNMYFPKKSRIVTTDIDTKFTPIFRVGPRDIMTSRDPRFFQSLQITKLLIWDKLGEIATNINKLVRTRIKKLLCDYPLGKLLELQLDGPVTRRYTLIKKKKQALTGTKVSEGDVLIDIELFALDIKVKYLGKSVNIGGLLDIAFMRPSEVGFETLYTNMYMNIPVLNPMTQKYSKRHLHISSPAFLIEDLYLLQKLKLRPLKKDKDRKRMYQFARDVLHVNVKATDTIQMIYGKSAIIPKTARFVQRPYFTKRYLTKALKVRPTKYQSITTRPLKILPRERKKGVPTQSNYIFNTGTHKWRRTTSGLYIRNEAKYRSAVVPKTLDKKKDMVLYGYNPERNSDMPNDLVTKAAEIPFVGLHERLEALKRMI